MRAALHRRHGRPGPPDFVGVGALSAGGAWWFSLLAAHPQIRSPRGRRHALHHFGRYAVVPPAEEDVDQYHARFEHAPGTICGEWTGTYMTEPWTPPLLALAAPDAKILVMLSDPVDGFRASLAEHRARREAGERQVFSNAAAEQRRYASQLRALHRFFPPERCLVLQYERCRADPAGQYRRTLRFLGVRDDFRPRRLRWTTAREHTRITRTLERLRVPRATIARLLGGTYGTSAREPLWPDLEAALRVALEPELRALAELVPDLDLALWRHAR